MTRRSPAQREEMLDALRARKLSKKETKHAETLGEMLGVKAAGDTTELLIHRFLRALERDRAGTSIPDGYPRGSGFEGRGGGGHKVDEDRWEGESTIALTSVELAIEQRLYAQKTVKDHHRDLTHQFEAALARAADDIAEARGLADRLDNLVDTNIDAAQAEKGCRSHARIPNHKGDPTWVSDAREAGGRNGLCRDCYDWTLAHGGELPPVEIVELFDRKGAGRLTTKDVAEAMKASKRKAS